MSSREVDSSFLTRAGYPIQEFDVGEVIFSDGDGGDYMFLVRSGSVEIMRHGADRWLATKRYRTGQRGMPFDCNSRKEVPLHGA